MKKVSNSQKGFTPIILVIIIIVLTILTALAASIFRSQIIPGQKSLDVASNSSSIATPSVKASPTLLPGATSNAKVNKTPTPTAVATSKTSPTPTSAPAISDNSCAYDLSGPTGAVQIIIKPKNGLVVGDQTVELQAKSGCKVLDGRSSDRQTMIARAGGNGYSAQNSVTYSSVPAGPYSVRIQYKGQWTGYSNVDAVPIQSKTVEFSVEGGTPPSIPTPTPKPKPICGIYVYIVPGSSLTAPYATKICVGNNSNPYQDVQQELVDYDGNGSWDYQGPSYGCHDFTFQNPGSYNPKAKIVNTFGEESDACQTSITIN